MEVTVEIKGLKDLEARLLELDALGGQKLMNRVLRKVAKPLLDRSRNAAVAVGRSGALAKSIRLSTRRRLGPRIVAAVAVRSSAGDKVAARMHNDYYNRKRKGVFYGWMLDQGHRIGTKSTGYLRKLTRRSGGHGGATGSVRPRMWWTPAVGASEAAMPNDFLKYLTAAVRRMEKRAGKTPNPDALVPE